MYVFDSCSLITMFQYYYQERFPSLWEKFGDLVVSDRIISVREVHREIDGHLSSLSDWATSNRGIFFPPTTSELIFVSELFKVTNFQAMVRKQERLQGKPVADPFLIAKAKEMNGYVVTQETNKPHSARIPNVCDHFGISCINLEQFMENESWVF